MSTELGEGHQDTRLTTSKCVATHLPHALIGLPTPNQRVVKNPARAAKSKGPGPVSHLAETRSSRAQPREAPTPTLRMPSWALTQPQGKTESSLDRPPRHRDSRLFSDPAAVARHYGDLDDGEVG